MANLVVKQVSPELKCLRPASRGLSIEKRAVGSRERSHSCEPLARMPKTRFKTPTESAIGKCTRVLTFPGVCLNVRMGYVCVLFVQRYCI